MAFVCWLGGHGRCHVASGACATSCSLSIVQDGYGSEPTRLLLRYSVCAPEDGNNPKACSERRALTRKAVETELARPLNAQAIERPGTHLKERERHPECLTQEKLHQTKINQ
ncbi:hypothetical protein NDU88_001851 [Pleurodeles waltl]|uniref:Uncharacterized protein n=1 Tax=Pleurodeles waltl TaxID=8319 RepID=A0AAV7Q499_PLEWA|nr:hypothetical protein NDU88_001851 [Pleurodeles waltl]